MSRHVSLSENQFRMQRAQAELAQLKKASGLSENQLRMQLAQAELAQLKLKMNATLRYEQAQSARVKQQQQALLRAQGKLIRNVHAKGSNRSPPAPPRQSSRSPSQSRQQSHRFPSGKMITGSGH